MKRFQSVLCTLVLALSLSSTVFAGNVHGTSATVAGNVHGVTASSSGILLSDFYGDITDIVVSIIGNVHG